jgi:DNA polymerase elongation subunit (family B)
MSVIVAKKLLKPKVKKIVAVVPNPSFRLIDFHFQDMEKRGEGSSSSSSEEETSSLESEGGKGGKRGGGGGAGGARKPKEFIIQMFGVNEKKETCCLYVRHFHPFFYVQVGQDWTESVANQFLLFVKHKINPSMEQDVLSVALLERGPLYGFAAGKQAKFVEISFANMAAFQAVKGLWYEKNRNGNRFRRPLVFQGMALDLFESNLPPLLRFFHIHEISPSGWVEIPLGLAKAALEEEKRTTCTYEWTIGCGDLISLMDKHTAVPYKICSYDIEATSSHGDFPLPLKTYRKLADQMIACFLNQQQTAAVNAARGKVLFRKLIMSAFGFEHFNGIDLVYPKMSEKIRKEQVGKWSDALLDMELFSKTGVMGKGVGGAGGGAGGEAWTLEQAFLQKQVAEEDDGGGEEGGGGGWAGRGGGSGVPEMEAQEGVKIMEILLDAGGVREAKVNILNCLLSKSEILPELKGDEVSFIGTTFLRYGETEPYLNHCLVVGSCDSVTGVEIVSCCDEKTMLLAWTDLIQSENPDIVIGYNIFMFDYEFMFQRAKENGCVEAFLKLSRILGEVCSSRNMPARAVAEGEEGGGGVEVEKGLEGILVGGGGGEEEDGVGVGGGWGGGRAVECSLKHSKLVIASGEYDLRYVEIKGRLQVDMFMYFRRDFQLSSYKLDDVAGIYIGDEISCVEEGEYGEEGAVGENCIFLTTKNVKGLHENDFIHVHKTEFTTDYLEHGRKFKVVGIEDADGGKKMLVIQGAVDNLEVWSEYAREGVLGWGIAKDDVSPQDIFRLTNGSSADRAIVAKYCIQDCNLVHTLFLKMDVLTTYVEMARICNVPMSYLVFRGQGIKLTSYVAQKCRKMGALMPDLDRGAGGDGQDGYEGAIVLPPKCAMYFDNPVACNDFASLYPSIAEAYNLCPQSLVWTQTFDLAGKMLSFHGEAPRLKSGGRMIGNEHYDNLESAGYKYVDVEFDTFAFVRKNATSKAVKTKTGTKICRWAQFPDGRKSIVPAIIHELLTARNDTKAQMKKESDMFMKNVLDKRQLGLKVTANSLYGQFGSKTSPFFQKDVAASITAIGRKMITYVKRMVEELYGKLVVDIPAIYSEKGYIANVKMEKTKCCAEYVYGDSVANYTPIYIRILYKTKNGIYAIDFDICTIEELSNRYGGGKWIHCSEEGKQEKEFCEIRGDGFIVETWTEKGWTQLYRVIRHKLALHKKMIRILTHTGLVDVTDDHSLLSLDGKEISPKEVEIGSELLHHSLPASISSLCNIDIDIMFENSDGKFLTMLEASQYYMFLKGQSKKYVLDYDEQYYYVNIIENEVDENINPNAIKKMCEIPYEGYVYDLTTENHHFAAGIGNMIVHNTDSVFFTFNLEEPLTGSKIRGKRALEISITLAQEVARLCSLFLPPPMKLAYEKTLMNFNLISKKRYVGMLYETDPDHGHLKYMGLALKRRDVCDYLKDVYGNLIMIFKEGSTDTIQRAIEYLNQALETLVEGGVPMDKLVFSKALRSYYKMPDSIAHAVLAERMALRDPGNRPKPGDRIRFAVVEIGAKEQKRITDQRNKNLPPEKARKTLLMGERIETPEYITGKKLKLDYAYYIEKQLLNPIRQLFGLILEPILEYKGRSCEIPGVKRELEEIRKNSVDLEDYMEKREKYCSKKVEYLLFNDIIIKINNNKNGLKPITDFYTVRK